MTHHLPQLTAKASTIDIIEWLEKETAQFIKKGNILLCGDFNARTSNAPDFIMDDDNLYLPMSSSYSVDKQILKRLNTDKTLDSRGKIYQIIVFHIN